MALTERYIIWYLLFIPLSYYLLKHLHHVLLPFNLEYRARCASNIFQIYDAPGLHPLLDRIVCVLVSFCHKAINDPLCFPLTATLLGLATTCYAIMSVEKSRLKGNSLLTFFMIMMGNVIGTGIIAPFAWLPWYGYSLRHFHKQRRDHTVTVIKRTTANELVVTSGGSNSSSSKAKSIPPSPLSLRSRILQHHSHTLPSVPAHTVFGIGVASLFGQFLPVAIAVSHGSSQLQRNILALFQYFPITYWLCETTVPSFVLHLNCKTKRGAVESVRLLYMSIAAINAFVWYWMIGRLGFDHLQSWGWQVFELFMFSQEKYNPVAYMLTWDILALLGTFTWWSLLEDGFGGVKDVLVGSLFFGPGAGVALYAMRREGKI